MAAMQGLDRAINPYAAVPMGGYNGVQVLAAKTAGRITIPAGAIAVLFSATDHFVAQTGADIAAWPAALVDDGTGPELNPTFRRLDGTASFISVMLLTAGIVGVKFFTAPK